MTSEVTGFETPEEEHLREQERLLAGLTEDLATKEAEFATEGVEFARFRHHYLRRFAPLYAEVDRLEAEVAKRLAVQEPSPDRAAKAEAAQAKADESARLHEQSREEAHAADADDAAGVGREPTAELKALYKKAAKALHPDLASDDEDAQRRTALMAAVNAAYDAGDAAAIQRILDGEAANPDAVVGDDFGARMTRVIRRIKQAKARLAELERLTAVLRSDPMWRQFNEVREGWRAGDDPLADDEAALRARIDLLKAQLAAFESVTG
jgi:hypothetical protein